mmetsp:Transcript_37080/g.86613  ORF Transcript_37080/g.86613 Transcript_37080/m.86613 type:complete len:222 (+) Transcript_37080:351-1016(+)
MLAKAAKLSLPTTMHDTYELLSSRRAACALTRTSPSRPCSIAALQKRHARRKSPSRPAIVNPGDSVGAFTQALTPQAESEAVQTSRARIHRRSGSSARQNRRRHLQADPAQSASAPSRRRTAGQSPRCSRCHSTLAASARWWSCSAVQLRAVSPARQSTHGLARRCQLCHQLLPPPQHLLRAEGCSLSHGLTAAAWQLRLACPPCQRCRALRTSEPALTRH